MLLTISNIANNICVAFRFIIVFKFDVSVVTVSPLNLRKGPAVPKTKDQYPDQQKKTLVLL